MSIRRKALGLGFLIALAVSAFSVIGASATTGGYFLIAEKHSFVKGVAKGEHNTKVGLPYPVFQVTCSESSYEGTAEGTPAETITVTPSYAGCLDPGGMFPAAIHPNGCSYVFKIGEKALLHNTMEIECPPGKAIVITSTLCQTKIPPQTVNGVVYKTAVVEGQHALTVEITASGITAHFEAEACVLRGTKQQATLNASVVLAAFDTSGERRSVTAKGFNE